MNTGLPVLGAGPPGQSAQTASISGFNTVTKLLLKDHLGSMVAEVAITGTVNASGQVTSVSVVANGIVVHGFGPWGNARNGLNGDQRGFTGHEHLAELGLIHMNGRIYDPVIGRFLQADPIIQAPHNAQSHNRYSYVMNNPLSFTDPSGFSSWTRFRDKWLKPIIAIGVAWALGPAGFWSLQGGVFGAISGGGTMFVASTTAFTQAQFLSSVMAGFAAGGISGGNVQSALQGAFSAGLTFGVGEISGAHAAADAGRAMTAAERVTQVAGHAAVGCATSAAAGGSCGAGAAGVGFSTLIGPHLPGGNARGFSVENMVSRMAVGAIASKLAGGRAENGAMSAAFEYLFNTCGRGECGFSAREFGEKFWSFAGKQINRLFPDAVSGEGNAFIANGNLQFSPRDGDVLVGGGAAKSYPTNFKLGGSITAQYIDGGSEMSHRQRLEVLEGWQSGGSICLGICLGRYYSPQISGPAIGTWSIGFGSIGASIAPAAYSSQLVNIYGRKSE